MLLPRLAGWTIGLGAVALAAGGAAINHRQSQQQLRETAHALTGGDPRSGAQAFQAYGCGACHQLSGTNGPNGLVGPDLDRISERAYIGGRLRNRPENLIRWIENPQGVDPGTAMPNLNVGSADARDLAAYLYAPG